MISQTEEVDFMKSRAARKQHDQIVDWTKKQFWRMKEDRSFVERQWYMNLAFFYGKQYAQWKPNTSAMNNTSPTLWIPPAPSWRVRAVINKTRSAALTQIAQLTNSKPNATVIPASAEERDMYAAMAAEQIWQSLSSTKLFNSVQERASWWNVVCGNGYIKTWWNFDAGTVEVPDTGGTKMGEIEFASETPFHIFVPDLLQEEIEKQPYIIHAQLKPVDFVKMNYRNALKGKDVKTQETTGREIFETAFMNIVGAPSTNKQNSVLLLEVYIKPGCVELFPEGGMYTILGDTIVQNFVGIPYPHKEYPFAKLSHVPSGKYYSTSTIEDLIPLQKEYNRKFSQIVENANRMGKLGLLYEKGSIDIRKITTEPGQGIPYNPGYNKPEPMPAPPLPSYIPQILETIRVDWDDLSGQHEVSKGTVPPGVTAATAISFLQERDETKLTPTFNSLERALEKVARQALGLVNKYWTVEKTIQVTGPEGSFDSMTFKGSNIDNGLDIRMEAGTSLPQSKAARQAFILDLMKMGFVPPQDGLEVLDMGGMAKIYERVQVDRRQAQRENLKMSKADAEFIAAYDEQNETMMMANPMHFGEEPVVDPITGMPTGEVQPKPPPLIIPTNTWDNHEMHILYHNNYRKSQAFEMLPEETKKLFEAHVQEHMAAMGVETVTMNPRAAAGLPPMDPYTAVSEMGQDNSQPGQAPGPEAMPDMQGMGV